jgi:hypothetical protein
MNPRLYQLGLILFLSLTSGLFAQGTGSQPTSTSTNSESSYDSPYWRCELPGGTYLVRLDTITAISKHEYIVDGAARVTEVNIDTRGSLQARFYFIEAVKINSPIGLGQSLLDKAQQEVPGQLKDRLEQSGQEPVWKKVVKNYPLTTHAHTVEFRLETIDQLTTLFNSIDKTWRRNRGTLLKLE